MYSNKENVGILTALLVAHGIRHAVVCPGSRNAPIVHNLNECPDIECLSVTDERSAGFYALGMSQALNAPVVVCVTSGTALLNLAPAVAEAYYQHIPLVVISADRPAQWIDQLDGQTLPQPGALGSFVRKAVSLPEPCDEEGRWYCNRLVNEALLEATADDPRPVHINVPITEPLFMFDSPALPVERKISRPAFPKDYGYLPPALMEGLLQAERPMIVFGQTPPGIFEGTGLTYLFTHVIVLHEALSPLPGVSRFDEVLYRSTLPPPDFVIHVGGTIVSKRLRRFIREAEDVEVWRISPSGEVEDTFMHLREIVVADAEFVLQEISHRLSHKKLRGEAYRSQWFRELTMAKKHAADYKPDYSQLAAVKLFEKKLKHVEYPWHVHYANSTAIRLANIYALHYVWCNRGVNGIEGSLSAAAGFSVVSGEERVFCIIGDLSFFYDQNALWNRSLRGNLRILLLNNGRGGIFNQLRGLEQSPARDVFVAAEHHTTAEGICRQNGVEYLSATDMEQMRKGMQTLLRRESDRPILLEVTTDAAEDERVFKDYYKTFEL